MDEVRKRHAINWLKEVDILEQLSLVENMYKNYDKEVVNQVVEESGSVKAVEVLKALAKRSDNSDVSGRWIQALVVEMYEHNVFKAIKEEDLGEEFTKWVMKGYQYLDGEVKRDIKTELPLDSWVVQNLQKKVDNKELLTPEEYTTLHTLLPDIKTNVYEELDVKGKVEKNGAVELLLSAVNTLQK